MLKPPICFNSTGKLSIQKFCIASLEKTSSPIYLKVLGNSKQTSSCSKVKNALSPIYESVLGKLSILKLQPLKASISILSSTLLKVKVSNFSQFLKA